MALDDTLNLSQAVKMTGFSVTKFKTEPNQKRLVENGATLEGTGKAWSIPVETLIKIGWLNDDETPLQKKGTATRSPRTSRTPFQRLSAEVVLLEEKVSGYEAKTAEAKKRLKEARKELDDVKKAEKATARERLEALDAQRKELEALLAD